MKLLLFLYVFFPVLTLISFSNKSSRLNSFNLVRHESKVDISLLMVQWLLYLNDIPNLLHYKSFVNRVTGLVVPI